MPARPQSISVDDWNIMKAKYMQSTLGDADVSEPSNFLGLNEKKKKEWEAWNSLRGLKQLEAQEIFVNSALDLEYVKDDRTPIRKFLDNYMKKHTMLDFQLLLPQMIITWMILKSIVNKHHAYTLAKFAGKNISSEHLARGAQAIGRMGGVKLDYNKTLAFANVANQIMKETLAEEPAVTKEEPKEQVPSSHKISSLTTDGEYI